VTLDDFDRLSRLTPQLISMRPSGEFMMEDLDWAGGIPAMMKNLDGLLNASAAASAARPSARSSSPRPPRTRR